MGSYNSKNRMRESEDKAVKLEIEYIYSNFATPNRLYRLELLLEKCGEKCKYKDLIEGCIADEKIKFRL